MSVTADQLLNLAGGTSGKSASVIRQMASNFATDEVVRAYGWADIQEGSKSGFGFYALTNRGVHYQRFAGRGPFSKSTPEFKAWPPSLRHGGTRWSRDVTVEGQAGCPDTFFKWMLREGEPSPTAADRAQETFMKVYQECHHSTDLGDAVVAPTAPAFRQPTAVVRTDLPPGTPVTRVGGKPDWQALRDKASTLARRLDDLAIPADDPVGPGWILWECDEVLIHETGVTMRQQLDRVQVWLGIDGELVEARLHEETKDGGTTRTSEVLGPVNNSLLADMDLPRWVWQSDVDVPNYRKWVAACGGASSDGTGATLNSALQQLEARLLPPASS